jgi:hypothetical protein
MIYQRSKSYQERRLRLVKCPNQVQCPPCTGECSQGDDCPSRDKLEGLGAGIWRWVLYSLCAFLLFVVVVVAAA